LVGGTSRREGRLEVFRDFSWGTVCDDGFTDVEAKVVCYSLGFGYDAIFLPLVGLPLKQINFRSRASSTGIVPDKFTSRGYQSACCTCLLARVIELYLSQVRGW